MLKLIWEYKFFIKKYGNNIVKADIWLLAMNFTITSCSNQLSC